MPQLDIKVTYLRGMLEEAVYMERQAVSPDSGMALMLSKSLCRLKLSGEPGIEPWIAFCLNKGIKGCRQTDAFTSSGGPRQWLLCLC